MAKNKSPGPDGLPAEVYQELWQVLKDPLFTFYQEIYQEGKMRPESMKGILNLIPKQHKDTRFLKNLRPITLLNVEYKLIEKVIARRIQPVLSTIIHSDQTGFMQNRRAALNIRKVMDTMKLCEIGEIEGMLLSLDYMKAFDRVELVSIQGSLDFFGFPQFIKEWVRILYTGFRINVQCADHLSKDIDITRSVHQGGCISAFLYIILAETLAICLRQEKQIEGIKFANSEQKLNQFADDTSVCMLFKQSCLDEMMKKLRWFHTQSGLLISYEKTCLYRIGSLRYSNQKLVTQEEISWVSEGINILGVFVTHTANILDINYAPVLQKVQGILNTWKKRDLSLIGKVTIINSMIASLLVHKMMVLETIPQEFVSKIETMISEFIWNGRKPKIPLRVLQLSKKGGLNLVNILNRDKALKCSWINILECDENCKNLAMELINTEMGTGIFRCNLNEPDTELLIRDINSPFWKDVLRAWCSFQYKVVPGGKLDGQQIWWNSRIRVGGKILWNLRSYQKGLVWVSQLY